MKATKYLLAVCLLAAFATFAEETKDVDKKWSEAAESKITQGATTISTPSETRAKLAKALADKHGRQSKVQKTETGYRIIVEATKPATQTASK